MNKQVAVVTRQLKPLKQESTGEIIHIYPVVVSAVISAPQRVYDDKDMNVASYLRSQGEEHVQAFKDRFVEFRDADWEIEITELTEGW